MTEDMLALAERLMHRQVPSDEVIAVALAAVAQQLTNVVDALHGIHDALDGVLIVSIDRDADA